MSFKVLKRLLSATTITSSNDASFETGAKSLRVSNESDLKSAALAAVPLEMRSIV